MRLLMKELLPKSPVILILQPDHLDAKIIAGGKYDKSIGYFIEPTIIVTTRYDFKTMVEEIWPLY